MDGEKHNSAKSDKTKRSMERASYVLSVEPNYSRAAERLDIDRNTIYTWLRDPWFRGELERIRNELVDDSLSSLKLSARRACEVLSALLDDECPKIRRGAANDVLSHISRFIELKDFDERLKALEGTIEKRGANV